MGGMRPGAAGGAPAAVTTNRVSMGWLDGSMTKGFAPMRMVRWYVKVDDTRELTVTVGISSTRGGEHSVEVELPRR